MHFAFLLAGAIFTFGFAGTVLAATPEAPNTVGPFVTFCKTNFKDCRGKISEVQLDALASEMSEPSGKICSVPRGIEPEAGAHAIVEWLGQHRETAGLSTGDGVKTAIKALWNCQTKVVTGVTSSGVPDHVGRYVSFCSDAKNYVKCANQTVGVSVDAYAAQLINDDHSHCSAPKGTTTPVMYAKVMEWLKAHPETYDSETEVGIAAAIDTTWPCR